MNFDVSKVTELAVGYVTALPIEIVVVALLLVVVFAYGLRAGKHQLVTLLLAELIAFPLITIFPYTELVSFDHEIFQGLQTAPLLTYLFFVLVGSFSFSRFIDADFSSVNIERWREASILSIAIVGNLLIVLYAISSGGEITIVTFLDKLFSTPVYIFWWFIGSLFALFYSSR